MSSESEQSILEELDHLIFDEHKLISYKWITNHFKIHIQKSKQILQKFVNKHTNKLLINHCITGYKNITIHHANPYNSQYKSPTKSTSKNKSNSNSNSSNNTNDNDMNNLSERSLVFTILIVPNCKLENTKLLFNKILNIHVHSISILESENINDFYGILYENDYKKQLNLITNYLSEQTINNNNNNNKKNVNIFSNIINAQVKTVSSPHLHRALAKDNKNKNIKPVIQNKNTFNDKIAKLKAKITTPLKNKFNKLEINNNNNKNESESKSESSQSQSLTPNSNANNNNNKKKKNKNGGIEACFAKAAILNKNKPKNDNQTEKEKDFISKKKKKDEITNFFDTESKTNKKQTENKKKKSKKKRTKKKSKKKPSIKPAKKRKRGEMEEENNLIPIDFDSESSESEYNNNNEYGLSDDEELEQIANNFKTNKNNTKRRKIIDSDDDNDIDIDIDVNNNDDNNNKKNKKSQKQIEREKLLHERKNNFFGKANGNKLRRKIKKQKKETRSYIDDKGYFVTEDIWVTDNDNKDEDENNNNNKNGKGNGHQYQNIIKDNDNDDDNDIDMMDKENSNDIKNGNDKKEKKVVKEKKGKGNKQTKKKKRNGNITSFFKVK